MIKILSILQCILSTIYAILEESIIIFIISMVSSIFIYGLGEIIQLLHDIKLKK